MLDKLSSRKGYRAYTIEDGGGEGDQSLMVECDREDLFNIKRFE